MARSQKLMRVWLIQETRDDQGRRLHHHMNVLVDADDRVKPGSEITLKDSDTPDERWTVKWVFETLDRVDIKVGWNNNI